MKHPKDDAYTGGHSSACRLSSTYHSYGPLEDLGATSAEVRMMIYFLVQLVLNFPQVASFFLTSMHFFTVGSRGGPSKMFT